MENPFVSIVVPACNEGETIAACLGSLARQNYPKQAYEETPRRPRKHSARGETKKNAKILPVRLWLKELLYNLNGRSGGLNPILSDCPIRPLQKSITC